MEVGVHGGHGNALGIKNQAWEVEHVILQSHKAMVHPARKVDKIHIQFAVWS